eukprot:Gb_08988 [translate_table: standard]
MGDSGGVEDAGQVTMYRVFKAIVRCWAYASGYDQLYDFKEALVPVLINEVIELGTKFNDKARSFIHFKDDIDDLCRQLKELHSLLDHAMPDYNRFDKASPYVKGCELLSKRLAKGLYKIARDAEDIIEDCQQAQNRRVSRFIFRLKIDEGAPTNLEANGIDKGAQAVTDERRRGFLRLASLRRNSIKRRSQPVEELPVGFESQIRSLQELLLTENQENHFVGVIGMGGVGKSLLMKCVWNSDKIQQSFQDDFLIWVSLKTGPWAWLQRTIAKNIDLDFNSAWTEEEARCEIFRRLEGKRYLMVLDDPSPDQSEEVLWRLGVPPKRSAGSKIVVLSRYENDLRRMKADMPVHKVTPLSDEYGWDLFQRHAFGTTDSVLQPQVEQAARSLAKKCDGHPLALKTVGAAMAGERDPQQWHLAAARRSTGADRDTTFFSSHPLEERKILRCLRSSYESLSPTLKLAFLYFAAFPENHVIRTTDLIDLWTAEGLLRAESPSDLGALGRRYLNIMIDRCMVEGIEVFPLEEINEHHRISLMYNRIESLPDDFRCRGLCTLVLRHSERLHAIPPNFLKRLTWLKTLDLSMTGIESLPVTLGRLKRLVYLNLSRTKLKQLPLSVTRLESLKSLNLFECKELEGLPDEMGKLRFLRYLNLRRCAKLRFLPYETSRIISLQNLIMDGCDLIEWRNENSPPKKSMSLKDVGALTQLTYLSFVCRATPIPHGLMRVFQKMDRLELCRVEAPTIPEDIQHMTELRDLRISRWERLLELPPWICNLTTLIRITFEYLNVKAFPAELAKLKYLRLLEIEHCYEITALPSEFGAMEAFPALEELRVDSLKALEQLPTLEKGAMTHMKEFRVRYCEKVKRFPMGLEKLKNVKIDIVGSPGLMDSLREHGGEDRKRLQHFLNMLNM